MVCFFSVFDFFLEFFASIMFRVSISFHCSIRLLLQSLSRHRLALVHFFTYLHDVCVLHCAAIIYRGRIKRDDRCIALVMINNKLQEKITNNYNNR